MSNFSKEQLSEIYGEYLPMFTKLANEAIRNGVDLSLDIDDKGKISFTSKEWKETDGELKLIAKHYIKQGKDYVADGSEIYK